MSQVITFYSYKGGVGRSMALANVGTLLAQWGHRVLMVDWDLEAPGLENFFADYLDVEAVQAKPGLIDLLAEGSEAKAWGSVLQVIEVPKGKQPLHLLTAGNRSNGYFKRVREFDVDHFYEAQDGGERIETLRNAWKANYDYVLVDSRTGVTDLGGICTIHLPDVLVLLFTPTKQGFEGVLDVAQRALAGQQELPYERYRLITLPLPSRFDTVTEFKLSREWLDRCTEQSAELFKAWLPADVERRRLVEMIKIPYVSYFSYGEKLPVIEQGTDDPAGLGYAYETLGSLLANSFRNVDALLNDRDEFVDEADLKPGGLLPEGDAGVDGKKKVIVFYSPNDREIIDNVKSHFLSLASQIDSIQNIMLYPGGGYFDGKIKGVDLEKLTPALDQAHLYIFLLSTDMLESGFAQSPRYAELLKKKKVKGIHSGYADIALTPFKDVEVFRWWNDTIGIPHEVVPLRHVEGGELERTLFQFVKWLREYYFESTP